LTAAAKELDELFKEKVGLCMRFKGLQGG